MKTVVYVFAGGKSTEHEVSLLSAAAMANSLDREKYEVNMVYVSKEGAWINLGEVSLIKPDEIRRKTEDTPAQSIAKFLMNFPQNKKAIVLLALHGTNGEDGRIQGLFDMAEIPYTGDFALPSAVNMDKSVMKDLLKNAALPQPRYTYFKTFEYEKNPKKTIETLEKEIGYPMFLKPANGGSSVGTSRAGNIDELKKSIILASSFDDTVVCEEEIVGREIQISVIGDKEPKASIPGEFIMERPFFDYEAKYLDKKIIPVAPARIDEDVTQKMRECAIKAYKATRCNSLARVDFFIKDDNTFYICELNTLPGFTPLSFTPVLWEKTDGTSYSGVVEKLIDLGFNAFYERKKLKRER